MNKDNRVLKPLKIGELVAEKPIIQGGMGVGVSSCSRRRHWYYLNSTDWL